jgi:hypothetical protein
VVPKLCIVGKSGTKWIKEVDLPRNQFKFDKK